MTRLNKDQVKYLALEGGGGKGNAFPGAIEALSDPRLMILQSEGLRPKNILGFAGASAGAITALFLSCGYDYEEIKILSSFQNFDEFFDSPKVGSGPRVGSCGPEKTPSTPEPAAESLGSSILTSIITSIISSGIRTGKFVLPDLKDLGAKALKELGARLEDAQLDSNGLAARVLVLLIKSHLPENSAARQQIDSNYDEVISSLVQDLGIFPGCVARDFFDKWITIARYRVTYPAVWDAFLKVSKGDKTKTLRSLENIYNAIDHPFGTFPGEITGQVIDMKPLRNAKFEDHKDAFKVLLAVTGTELETLKSHVFSYNSTPKFHVADAVRISMSLPFVFKPLVLDEYLSDGYLKGPFIDGGLLNNIPINLFNNEDGANPKTLGLRLGADERTPISVFTDFIKAYALLLAGTGESDVSHTLGNYDQGIILNTDPVGLFDFQPSDSVLKEIQTRARDDTLRYFGLDPPS